MANKKYTESTRTMRKRYEVYQIISNHIECTDFRTFDSIKEAEETIEEQGGDNQNYTIIPIYDILVDWIIYKA